MRPFGTILLSSLVLLEIKGTGAFEEEEKERPNPYWTSCKDNPVHNIYGKKLSIDNIFENQTISLDDYKGKTLLLLNVASFWGFTDQYYALNDLIEKYAGKGFSILGVPCNQFAYQEPAANWTELYNSMAYVRPGMQRGYHFVPKFPLTKKVNVNGEEAHPIMIHLRESCDPPMQKFNPIKRLMYNEFSSNDVRWNFEKWLIDKEGKPFRRYSAWTTPEELEPDVKYLLGKAKKPLSKGNSREHSKVEW